MMFLFIFCSFSFLIEELSMFFITGDDARQELMIVVKCSVILSELSLELYYAKLNLRGDEQKK